MATLKACHHSAQKKLAATPRCDANCCAPRRASPPVRVCGTRTRDDCHNEPLGTTCTACPHRARGSSTHYHLYKTIDCESFVVLALMIDHITPYLPAACFPVQVSLPQFQDRIVDPQFSTGLVNPIFYHFARGSWCTPRCACQSSLSRTFSC